MDFFASQELARKNTRKLVWLLVLTVISLIAAIYGLILVLFFFTNQQKVGDDRFWLWMSSAENLELLAAVVVGVLLVVGCGMLYKMSELRAGGSAIAHSLQGQRIQPNTTNLAERRLLNVVEEMALASGVAVPPVYVLENEPGINAFAAGHTIDDCIIGVNRGTIETLNRDELQGVIGHEFSHILNGDMRMSLRMIGLLNGILVIALIGYQILRVVGRGSSSSSKKDGGGKAAILFLGAGLVAIGSIGLFFARLIKSSISRQREYLADASSVQFTRNPMGIAGALKMIGVTQETSRVRQANAESISHMFFANMTGSMLSNAFATHPPLVTRIQRIEPRFEGLFEDYLKHRATATISRDKSEDERKPKAQAGASPFQVGPRIMRGAGAAGMPFDPAILIASIGEPSEDDVIYSRYLIDHIPAPLQTAIRDLFLARCVAFASLLDDRPEVREQQLRMLTNRENDATVKHTLEVEQAFDTIDIAYRLPLFEILQATLAGLSANQYQTFRGTVLQMIQADQAVSLFEFFLHHHLLGHLDRHFGKGLPQQVLFEQIEPLKQEVGLLLGVLAEFGHVEEQSAGKSFAAAIQTLPNNLADLTFARRGWDYSQLAHAIKKLSHSAPAVKKQVLAAAAVSITFDHEITPIEAELYRAMGESLGCPVPPIMALKSTEAASSV